MERLRLDLLDRRAAIETDRIDLQRREEQFALAKRLFERGSETEFNYLTARLQRDVVEQEIQGQEKAMTLAESQLRTAESRIAQLAEAAKADQQAFIAPLRDAVAAQQARIQSLELQVDSLIVRAPVGGMVAAVYKRPGQAVAAGEPIVTIAYQSSRRIVSYVRSNQRIDPRPGMPVSIKRRHEAGRVYDTRIAMVGPQFEPVPPQQLRNPAVPEWGLPVSIDLPPDVKLLPGELVDVVFQR